MTRMLRCVALIVVAMGMSAAAGAPNASLPASRPALREVEVALVDDQATGYATFQSHNQKMICNRNGIFMAYIRSRNEPYTAQQWRLVRSRDGGRRFSTVFEATHATNPAVLETDADANVYLARPDFLDNHVYLYRFLAADDYAKPLISRIDNASAGKFAMMYDAPRRQLYFFSANNTFHVVGLDGRVKESIQLLQPGPDALLQYPLLSLDRGGDLFAAWTTQKHGVYLYWDIHTMRSRDAGSSWSTLAGAPLKPPVIADQHGPADRVTLNDEFEPHSWLANLLVKDGKLHLAYQVQMQPARQHYVRYDLRTGRKDLDTYPEFKGETLSLQGLDGFFAARADLPGSPLYCVMSSGGRIACLVSRDNGRSWHDHAVSRETFRPYAIGGCREITADGHIIGAFTDVAPDGTTDPKTASRVYFFRIRAGGAGNVAAASCR